MQRMNKSIRRCGGGYYLVCSILETELSATRAQCLLSVSPDNVTTSFALIDHSFHRTGERRDATRQSRAARKFSSGSSCSEAPGPCAANN